MNGPPEVLEMLRDWSRACVVARVDLTDALVRVEQVDASILTDRPWWWSWNHPMAQLRTRQRDAALRAQGSAEAGLRWVAASSARWAAAVLVEVAAGRAAPPPGDVARAVSAAQDGAHREWPLWGGGAPPSLPPIEAQLVGVDRLDAALRAATRAVDAAWGAAANVEAWERVAADRDRDHEACPADECECCGPGLADHEVTRMHDAQTEAAELPTALVAWAEAALDAVEHQVAANRQVVRR